MLKAVILIGGPLKGLYYTLFRHIHMIVYLIIILTQILFIIYVLFMSYSYIINTLMLFL